MHFLKTTAFAVAIAALGSVDIWAQTPKFFGKPLLQQAEQGKIRCLSSEYEEYLQLRNTSRSSATVFEHWIAPKVNAHNNAVILALNPEETIITIPVVVHIIHNGDAIGVNENITDEQILSQITVLNQDFRRMEGTPGFNTKAVGADVQIQFCLAQTDPNGNLTNGINRVNMGVNFWTELSIEQVIKPQTQWDPNKYFNIWVCNFGGTLSDVLGYAQFPSLAGIDGITEEGSAETDGLIIGYKYFGSEEIYPDGTYEYPYNYGRTTTHEMGHALGLRHTWGDTMGCSGSDYCNDTPATYYANTGCPAGKDSCTSNPGSDMIENYMDYTNDACMNIFTKDQKARMIAVMQNSPRRASLTTSTVCQAPTMNTPDFDSLDKMRIYPNPASSKINIEIPIGILTQSYTIYNSIGQVIVATPTNSNSQLTIDISNYSNGIYFIRIRTNDKEETLRFIKN